MRVAQPPLDLNHPRPFNVAGPRFKTDPYPAYAAMRAVGPLVPVRMQLIGRCWLTSTYEATEEVMKRGDLFMLEGRNAGKSGVAGTAWLPPSLKRLANSMLNKDEPDHRRLRKLVDQAFSRRGVLQMRPRIEQLADGLIDGFAGEAEVDIVADYSRRLPLAVICELLGLPQQDHERFSAWAVSLTSLNSVLSLFRAMGPIRQMAVYLRGQIELARQSDHPGLISELVRAEESGDRLNEDELVSMVFLLLLAGFETTTHLISGSLLDLARNPEQKAFLLADPAARMERAVEELARHVSPVQGTKPRFVVQDTDLCGQRLKRGELIMAMPGAANADPAMFESPEDLRLERFPNPHLVFSSGIHFCLGQQLARVEAQVALSRLYARFPRLEPVSAAAPDYADRLAVRALRSLPLRLTPARQVVAA